MEPVEAGAFPRDVTDRDKLLLCYLAEQGFASAHWIKDAFWTGQSNCNHYRRLSKLRALGLVEHLIGDAKNVLGYRLTKKGALVLRQVGAKEVEQDEVRSSYRTSFDHDDSMLGVGNVIRSLPGVSDYQCERRVRAALAKRYGHKERRRDGYKVPDGIFCLVTKKRRYTVAVELELAVKNRLYCERILSQLATSSDFNLVFVIVKDAKMIHRFGGILAHVRSTNSAVRSLNGGNGFYFCVLSDLLRERGETMLIGEGEKFKLSELAA